MFVSACICLSTDQSKKASLCRDVLSGSRKLLNPDADTEGSLFACRPERLPCSKDEPDTNMIV